MSSRSKNSVKNLYSALFSQFIIFILSFAVRKIFIVTLGSTYLGVNGLFSNILTLLSLTELGFGTAMVYSMYKPLAVNDTKKLQALMNLYARVYTVMGIVVAVVGVSLVPFLGNIINADSDAAKIDNLTLIYLLYLANSVSSYFFSYKRSILNADQKAYICSRYRYIFTIVKSVLQIAVLFVTYNFIAFLIVQILTTFAENIYISMQSDKMYPFLKKKSNERLAKEELHRIVTDVKALILSKIGFILLEGTDNIIITSFVGVNITGIYSNYVLVTGSLALILWQIAGAITASIGNFVAKESKEKQEVLFYSIDFINFWLYSFCAVCVTILINPFISLFFGAEFVMDFSIGAALSLNFLIKGILDNMWVFRSTMGLFKQGKYRPIIAAIVNLVFSVLFAMKLGVLGVLLGTTAARVFINLWYDPLIIFKYGFNKPAFTYYLTYIKKMLLTVLSVALIYCFNLFVLGGTISILNFAILMVLCAIIPNLIMFIAYRKSPQFIFMKDRGVNLVKGVLAKLKSR